MTGTMVKEESAGLHSPPRPSHNKQDIALRWGFAKDDHLRVLDFASREPDLTRSLKCDLATKVSLTSTAHHTKLKVCGLNQRQAERAALMALGDRLS